MRLEFVIPAEALTVRQPKLHPARAEFHHPRPQLARRIHKHGAIAWRNLLVVSQIVQDVRECLGMHQAMFDCHMTQRIRERIEMRSELAAHAPVVLLHFGHRGPGGGWIGGKLSRRRVDPESEEAVELRMKRCHFRPEPAEQIPVEGLHVSQVEDDAVTFGDGPFVNGIRPHQPEQFICPGPGILQRGTQIPREVHKFLVYPGQRP